MPYIRGLTVFYGIVFQIDISRCHYLIDVDLPYEVEYEPRYASYTKDWKVVASAKFLDASRWEQVPVWI